jgi:hypothetical protein
MYTNSVKIQEHKKQNSNNITKAANLSGSLYVSNRNDKYEGYTPSKIHLRL